MPSAFDAIENGDLDALTASLDGGTDINASDDGGWTLLMEAADWNRVHMVNVLLSRGANVHRKTCSGWTALHLTTFNESSDLFPDIFSAAGPRAMNLPDSDGWTPLHWLAFHGSEQTAFALSHPGIDVSILSCAGRAVLEVSKQTMRTALQTYHDQEARWQPLRYTWIKLLMITRGDHSFN
jgi:hypothetical protein